MSITFNNTAYNCALNLTIILEPVHAMPQVFLENSKAFSILQFFERLELFAEDSLQKQAELTERIKREVCTSSVGYQSLVFCVFTLACYHGDT